MKFWILQVCVLCSSNCVSLKSWSLSISDATRTLMIRLLLLWQRELHSRRSSEPSISVKTTFQIKVLRFLVRHLGPMYVSICFSLIQIASHRQDQRACPSAWRINKIWESLTSTITILDQRVPSSWPPNWLPTTVYPSYTAIQTVLERMELKQSQSAWRWWIHSRRSASKTTLSKTEVSLPWPELSRKTILYSVYTLKTIK